MNGGLSCSLAPFLVVCAEVTGAVFRYVDGDADGLNFVSESFLSQFIE